MKDYLVRATTEDGFLRAAVAVTTDVTEKICVLQQTDLTATVALGRLLTGAALCSSLLKGDQRLAVAVEGNGPVQKIQAETDAVGNLRASIKQPVSGILPKKGQYDVAGAIGRAGFLHMVKDLGLKKPYRGMVQLLNSEIGSDLAYYFSHSEQTPTSIGVGVTLNGAGGVSAAGGFLIQAMPGCPEELLVDLEKRLMDLPPVSNLLRDGKNPEELLGDILVGTPYEIHGSQPLNFKCTCNQRQAGQLLNMLGADELAELAAQKEKTVVTCEYCRQQYQFNQQDVKVLMAIKTSRTAGETTIH